MTRSSEELTSVTMEGGILPHSHAVLIETSRGWHVELEGVPRDTCPLVQSKCEIAFDTWEGDHYVGTVEASFVSDDADYVLVTGTGRLQRIAAADVG